MSVIVGPTPTQLTCPFCYAVILTKTENEPSTRTHIAALLLCIIFLPCFCCPYLLESCQNTNHFCPNCNAYLGTYKR